MVNSNTSGENIETIINNVHSPLEAYYRRVEEQANQVCMVQPIGEGNVVEYSWADIDDEIRRIAAYLRSLDLPGGSHIALISKNCAHWIMADLAIWLAGHVSIPIYPTLTADSVNTVMTLSKAKVIFIGKLDDWEAVREGIPSAVVKLTLPNSPAENEDDTEQWAELVKSNKPLKENPKPDLGTLATIVYTSGTTGTPKGVMHTFRTMAIAGEMARLIYDVSSSDRIISYLPLSHVAERAAVEVVFLYAGFKVFFAHSLDTFAEDLRRASPTIFFAVPRIWTKFHQQVIEKIPPRRLDLLLKLPLISTFLARKIKTAMGLQEVRIALSGASPLSTSLIAWYKSIGIEISEVYGMTENMAYSHTTRIGESVAGYVGRVNPSVKCIIAENGEVLVSSPCTMIGYYNEPDLTSQVIDKNGFLHTGDVGTIDSQGRLKITGRIKEIFKSSKGKYIAPAPIENRLMVHPDIEQVCVTGASLPQPLALINLSESASRRCKDAESKQLILGELLQLLDETNSMIDKHENLKCLVLVPEVWGIENGFTTPTLKIKRQQIDDHYSKMYETWCEEETRVKFS